jgi:hypothetical protein
MDETAPYYSDFQTVGDGEHHLVRGHGRDTVSIAAKGERLLIVLKGEPSCDTVVDGLQDALREGWMHLSMKTLVDMTGYMGVIDWSTVQRLRGLADWGDRPEKSCVAYVIRNSEFGAIIRAISALFQHTRHRAFSDRAEAIAWLMH